MLRELSTMKYGYRSVVEGCYDMAISNVGYSKPEESKNDIVDAVIELLNQHSQTVILK
jgi:hypothetical protein